ncbi:hypothetical protein PPL_09443 [Heterostelium album PN500]|uniref:Uncharacterized protein n=1 Tax=Heterostelium pallidum (strain ATCC 26659 / Pp 5 / PN500) TaxID=670386 RepID=D3BPH5_HETP5|nr:hypothetical protein PPL_09443 [Heterostelium album PN500]EFA76693.1 hypothetical protein PPL_09443 [Heterostelium album PN500]|eukprot:XP_020428825.1 hypothetical protein PPL_09443 [Heterostelium album PN500]
MSDIQFYDDNIQTAPVFGDDPYANELLADNTPLNYVSNACLPLNYVSNSGLPSSSLSGSPFFDTHPAGPALGKQFPLSYIHENPLWNATLWDDMRYSSAPSQITDQFLSTTTTTDNNLANDVIPDACMYPSGEVMSPVGSENSTPGNMFIENSTPESSFYSDTESILSSPAQVVCGSPILSPVSTPASIIVNQEPEPIKEKLVVPKTEELDGRKSRRQTPMLRVKEKVQKEKSKVTKKAQKDILKLVSLDQINPLSAVLTEVPQFLVQNGCGTFKFRVSGRANPSQLIIVARPTDSADYSLEGFATNVPASGLVDMNIKFVRINSDSVTAQIAFYFMEITENGMTPVYHLLTNQISFLTNTKDLPTPTITSVETTGIQNRHLLPIANFTVAKVTADRMKWGTTNELTFFIVDENKQIKHIVRQGLIAPPEKSKKIAYFRIPNDCLNQNYKLHVNYIAVENLNKKQSASEKKAVSHSIVLPKEGAFWTCNDTGFAF